MISGSALWISFNSASTEIKGIGVSQNQTPFQKPQLLSSVISWSRAASWLPRGVVFVQMVSVLSTGPSLSIKDQSSLPLQSHQYLKVVSATLGIWVSHQVGLSTFPSFPANPWEVRWAGFTDPWCSPTELEHRRSVQPVALYTHCPAQFAPVLGELTSLKYRTHWTGCSVPSVAWKKQWKCQKSGTRSDQKFTCAMCVPCS